MIDLISQVADWRNKTPQEIADELNALTVMKTDNQLYTYAGVIDRLQQEAGFAFRATMRTLAANDNPAQLPQQLFEPLNFAHDRLTVGGLDLSRQDVQDLLDAILAIPQLAPFVPALKLIGRYFVSPAANSGLETVTAEQVESAINIQRLTNATALFSERMTVSGDASVVWAQAWEDAGA